MISFPAKMNARETYQMKVVIAHAGQQTSFRRAEALKNGGFLFKYITSVYLNKNSNVVLNLLRKIKKDEALRLEKHRCNALSDKDVKKIDTLCGMVLLLINRVDKKRKIYNVLNYQFSYNFARKVAKYSIKEKIDILVMMGAAPYGAFDYLNKHSSNIIKIFDMSSIAYNYQTEIMKRERENLPESWRHYIVRDKDNDLNDQLMKNISSAEYIIVSSSFAKQSILANGFQEDRVFTIPYGIDASHRNNVARYKENEKLKILFVGSVSCEKGIYYLLEAVSQFPSERVELTVVGKKYISDDLLSKYVPWVTFIGDIPSVEVEKYYCSSHLLIVPTLFDSFGRVITEAMSYGIPVISTSSAGAADYIKDNENGFVISPSSVQAISEKIQFFLENPDEIERMGKKNANTAHEYSWERYYSLYCDVMENIWLKKHI